MNFNFIGIEPDEDFKIISIRQMVSEPQEEEVEVEEVEEKPEQEEKEDNMTDQSGGDQLDTELKNILYELQANNKNLSKYKGGKSSKKSSKKSKKSSKKQSRRGSDTSNVSHNTYNIDSDFDSGDSEEYLTSTSSMNTSDINIKHYRS